MPKFFIGVLYLCKTAYTFSVCSYGDQVTSDKTGRTSSTHGGDEKCIHKLNWKHKERENLRDLGIVGGYELGSHKRDVTMCTGFK